MTVTEFDPALAKDRIIKWLKADTELFNLTNPEGNPVDNQPKLLSIIYGVPEDNHWESELPPFAAVSNGDQLVVSDQFFGSVINDELTSSYEIYQFDITFVVQAASSEETERQIDYLHRRIKERLKENVRLKDTDSSGNLIASSEICETSKCGTTTSLNTEGLTRRLFAYRIQFLIEVQV